LAEDLRLTGVLDTVTCAPEANAIFKILDDGERIVRHLAKEGRRKRHPVAAQASRHAEPFSSTGAHAVEQRKCDMHETSSPRRSPVGDPVLCLHGESPSDKASRECPQQVGRDECVGVHDYDGIRESIPEGMRESKLKRVPLATK
jgi:hypothetical protein